MTLRPELTHAKFYLPESGDARRVGEGVYVEDMTIVRVQKALEPIQVLFFVQFLGRFGAHSVECTVVDFTEGRTETPVLDRTTSTCPDRQAPLEKWMVVFSFSFVAPRSPGTYAVDITLDGRPIGARTFNVVTVEWLH